MCGIFALFLNRPLNETDCSLGWAGMKALSHRGPDGSDEWLDVEHGVFIGHDRLAIIDPTPASDQPMQREDCVLAYNGEIYNFQALRAELEDAGLRFTTSGDAEVFLRAWQVWGEETLDRLDGMFASIFWDRQTATAHLAIDPFGEKPLYWAQMKDGVYVSSELGPLAQLLRAEPKLEGDMLTAYLALGYVPAPDTAYPQIKRLSAASVLTIHHGQVQRVRRYWTPPIGEPGRGSVSPLSERELDRIHESLVDSLRVRLIADVPLCLFLSGGVDSPLVAAMTYRELGTTLDCITVAFPRGTVANEAPQASAIAQHLGLQHRIIESDEDSTRAGAGAVLDLFGQPNENITVLSVFQMARAAAARGFKVALTGMGGDEIFYGYGKHVFFYRYRHLYNLPEPLRVVLGGLARAFSHFRPNSHFGYFSRLIGVHDWERYLANKNYPAIEWLRRMPSFQSWAKRAFKGNTSPCELSVPFYEVTQVMPNSHLPSLDLGSMRASLELRTPFLSRKVAETVAEFDPRAFMAFGQKSVLRRLLTRYLPKELVDQPKRGFIFPADQFLNGFGDGVPVVPGVSTSATRSVWQRREEASGWRRLAVRLALAYEFNRGFDTGGEAESP